MRLILTLALAPLPALAATPDEVVAHWADIGQAKFSDTAAAGHALQAAVAALVAAPSDATLQAARDAWRAARRIYPQTEVYRFGNPVVDAWEPRVNSWPLDEGLIDRVAGDVFSEENPLATLNVIASPTVTIGGRQVDAGVITPDLIRSLHEAEGIEANVASGWHAVEFLLWGQDLNGTGPGAGNRPWTDFAAGAACTDGNCDRRAAYLVAATDLLVADLDDMAAAWAPGGAARSAVTGDARAGLTAIFTGMGSLSYGELAGERMRLGLMLNDPEEEQDCFSDNTHNSHYYDGIGIRDAYLGTYTRPDGTVMAGPAPADLVAAAAPEVDRRLRGELDASVAALAAIKASADSGAMAYDQMLAPGNAEGERMITAAVDALVAQTASLERAMGALALQASFEGSDSLQSPGAVFQ